jgi:hypothetical protein
LEREADDASVQFTVPVYPPFGVTVTVDVAELPAATVIFPAVTLKEPVPDVPDEVPTVMTADPVELENAVLPEYVATIEWEPLAVEEKEYVADPLTSWRDDVLVIPSTLMVRVPVGTPLAEDWSDATVIVMESLAPEETCEDAAESVVEVACSPEDTDDDGQSIIRLEKSTEPKPDASSYPVLAEYALAAEEVQYCDPAVQAFDPEVTSWKALL